MSNKGAQMSPKGTIYCLWGTKNLPLNGNLCVTATIFIAQ